MSAITNDLGEQVPEGYSGNLKPEQEKSLKELWRRLFTVFETNVERSEELERQGGPKAAQTGNELASNTTSKEDAKKPKDDAKKAQELKSVDEALNKYGGKYLHQAMWDATKMDSPDQLLLRFLRARNFDVDRALGMAIAAIQFRLDVNVEELLFKGEEGLKDVPGFLNQFRRGISYIEGNTDKNELPIYFIHVARHFTNAQKIEVLQQFVVLAMENARMLCTSPIEKVVIVFDMEGFGLKNMDWQCVLFIVKCLEAFYPESLQRVYVHGAPWLFKGIWAALQPLLDPNVQAKIKFSNKAHELEEYVPKSRFRKGMGGTLDWDWSYPEPQAGENVMLQDVETKHQILDEYKDLQEQYEEVTLEWLNGSEEAADRRKVLHKQLRLKYYQLAPYVRAVNVYQRTKVLRNDFTVEWTYPQLDGSVEKQTVNDRHNVPALIQWLRDHGEDTLEESVGGTKSPAALAPAACMPAEAKNATPPSRPSKKKASMSGKAVAGAAGAGAVAAGAASNARKGSRKPAPIIDGDSASASAPTEDHATQPHRRRGHPRHRKHRKKRTSAAAGAAAGGVSIPRAAEHHDEPEEHDDFTHDELEHEDLAHEDLSHDELTHDDVTHDDISHDDISHDDINHDDINHDAEEHDASHEGGIAAGVAAGVSSAVAGGAAMLGLSSRRESADTQFESADEFLDDDDEDWGEVEEERHAVEHDYAEDFDLDDDEQSMLSDDEHDASIPDTVIAPSYVNGKASLAECQQTEAELRADLEAAHEAMQLFLNSDMQRAEEMCMQGAQTRLYRAAGMGVINTVKSLMTFDPEDMQIAMKCCKHTRDIASVLRKKKRKLSNLLPGKNDTASMTLLQQHAELVYAESVLCKAIVGILYSGDTVGLVREAMGLRTAYIVLRDLLKMVESADHAAEKANRSGQPSSRTIDEDLRSGVYFGMGSCMLVLSLLEPRMLKFMEGVGFVGDRRKAMELFERAGGWSRQRREPALSASQEGVRRPLCDLAILIYHLVISANVPVPDVDLAFADRVLSWNLHRFPQGTFYLFFSAMLYSSQALPEKAIECYRTAIEAQREYKQLHHLCYWKLSLTYLTTCDYDQAYECYDVLSRESNWSKAIYQYAKAAMLYESSPMRRGQAEAIISTVPKLVKKMAGRHLPFERFVTLKAASFSRLSMYGLPAMEFSYLWHCLAQAPVFMLVSEQLSRIDHIIDALEQYDSPASFAGGASDFFSVYCLAFFLRGVALRYIAFPEKFSVVRPPTGHKLNLAEVAEDAVHSFEKVFEHAEHLDAVDRYIVYFAHYELGSLYAAQGDVAKARHELELVRSRKPLVAQDAGRFRSGKAAYPLSHVCQMRASVVLETLGQGPTASSSRATPTRTLTQRLRGGMSVPSPANGAQAKSAAVPAAPGGSSSSNTDSGRLARLSRLIS